MEYPKRGIVEKRSGGNSGIRIEDELRIGIIGETRVVEKEYAAGWREIKRLSRYK